MELETQFTQFSHFMLMFLFKCWKFSILMEIFWSQIFIIIFIIRWILIGYNRDYRRHSFENEHQSSFSMKKLSNTVIFKKKRIFSLCFACLSLQYCKKQSYSKKLKCLRIWCAYLGQRNFTLLSWLRSGNWIRCHIKIVITYRFCFVYNYTYYIYDRAHRYFIFHPSNRIHTK